MPTHLNVSFTFFRQVIGIDLGSIPQDLNLQHYHCENLKSHSFNIALLQVVPLSSHHGIIQWVDGTKVLKALMLDVLDKNEKKS
jgi:hypothetical protein